MKVRRTSTESTARGLELLAGLEDDAGGAPAPGLDSGDRRFRADLRAIRSRAALAIALEMPPVPPFGMPQARNAPSISPM